MVKALTAIVAKWNAWKDKNVNVEEILELDKAKYKQKISDAKSKVIKLVSEKDSLITTHKEFEGRIYKAKDLAKKAAKKGDEAEAKKYLVKAAKLEATAKDMAATIADLEKKEEILKQRVGDMEEALEMLDANNIYIKAQLSAAEVSKDAAEMLTGMGEDDTDLNEVRDLAKERTKKLESSAKAMTDLADEGFLKPRVVVDTDVDMDEVEKELKKLMKE
jgi:phage shock protein A